MGNAGRLKKVVVLGAVILAVGIVTAVLRGPSVSDALKKTLLPELERASGRTVLAKKISINLLPLFVEAEGLRVLDANGASTLIFPRVKAYVDPGGLLVRQLVIRRLVVKQPEIAADRSEIEAIIAQIEAYLARPSESALKVKVVAVELRDGKGVVRDSANKATAQVAGLHAEVLPGKTVRVVTSARKIQFAKEGWPAIAADVDARFSVAEGVLRFKRFAVGLFGSRLEGSGVAAQDRGKLDAKVKLLAETVRRLFGLGRSGQGNIDAAGLVTYEKGNIDVDVDMKGSFYIETLMELLQVKENVEGWISVKGKVKGPVRDLQAAGKATLKRGHLFGVDVDSLACGVSYAKGVMKFVDGRGNLYQGKAKFEALMHLPVVDFYSFAAEVENIDSKPVFGLIGWDPGVQPGKVVGSISTAGGQFDPSGWFRYRSAETGRDFLGRIRDISGRYAMKDGVLKLEGLKFGTGRTDIVAEGTADTTAKTLNLKGFLRTKDITDVTAPYYTKLTGHGNFDGKIIGTFDDPVISGNMEIGNPAFGAYSSDLLRAAFSYRKNYMSLGEMTVKGEKESAQVTGDVVFSRATGLFDLSEPEFHLAASLKNVELGKFTRVFYAGFDGTGRFDAECRIGGTAADPQVSGSASVGRASVYQVPFDSASFLWKYQDNRISFSNMKVNRGKSSVSGFASVDAKGGFSYRASSEQFFLSDIVQRQLKGDAQLVFSSEGRGTFDDPSIRLNGRIKEGTLRGRLVGTGTIAGEIDNRKMSFTADLLDGKVNLSGKGVFAGEMPWEAKVMIQTGRYDQIIGAFLQNVPEDLVLTVGGEAFLRGDRKHINGSSLIRQLSLSMYGYSFANEKDIRLDLHDRDLSLGKILLRSGSTDVSIDGRLTIGKEYNIVIEGSSDLSPIKSLSKKIGFLDGDAEYVVSVTGGWDMPQVNGGVTIKDGAFSLKDYPYRLSSLKGYFFMDNDRIVMEKVSGKLGGGNIALSGIVYLKKFAVKRFYIETVMDNITTAVSGDFSVNFGGRLLYKGTPSARMVSGDIAINRARYKERVEWKSWLLKARKPETYRAEISDLERTELNVRIVGKDSILVDNNVTRATVSADMLLRGSIFQPVLLGRLETREGTVYFRNIEFRILHASADFTDTARVNPYVNISAETVVKDYKIKMNMDGQLDHFTMALSSEPSLKEMDILSLLAVGQTGGELKGLEGGIGASEATSFVTGKLQDVMEERLKSITGLDRVQIDPHVSKSTGSIVPRVTVSKRLLGERMFVTYTSSVGSAEEQIVKLEYFLSKNMSVLGVRDERGIIGGDVRFRFDFR